MMDHYLDLEVKLPLGCKVDFSHPTMPAGFLSKLLKFLIQNTSLGICGLVGRATARGALCRGFDSCRQHPQGVAVDFDPKQASW